MSHIVKGKVNVAYKEDEFLIKALSGLGILLKDQKLYRVGAGYTSETYDLVLVDEKNKDYRIGYKKVGGVWHQFQEDYGSYGRWTKKISDKVQDRYLAYHYEKQLNDEGYDVVINQENDGSLVLEADERCW